ncbi:MAG: hypothetical protein ABI624_23855 [Casimicrobiaceae bacterium]
MHEITLLLMIVASGFVASEIITTFYKVVTGAKEYAPQPKNDFQRVATVGLTIFTGPSLLTANVLRADETGQPKGYIWIMLGLTLLWSYLLGLFFVTLALALPSPF